MGFVRSSRVLEQALEDQLRHALSMTADTGRGPRTEALTALADLRERQGRPEESLQLLDTADNSVSGTAIRAACLLHLGHAHSALFAARAAAEAGGPV